MEDRKLNELKDEALDAVTGGAYYKYNEETKQWDVFDKDGKKVSSVDDMTQARRMALFMSQEETPPTARYKRG